MSKEDGIMLQQAPWPVALEQAVDEFLYLPGWRIFLTTNMESQDCSGLYLAIVPNKPDSYHPDKPANTLFPYPVPAAAFNRESWEEWIWARIEETEGHERAEWFRFREEDGTERRPFKPAHADGWNPGVIRSMVSDTVVNTPNAGRLVQFPCRHCGHNHHGKMGEHFTIVEDRGCTEDCTVCII